MLKKAVSVLLFFLIFNLTGKAQCKISEIVELGKLKIQLPFIYDGFVITQLTLDNKTKRMQTQFTALKGQEYKLYFCTSGFDEELNISLKSDKNDIALFDQKAIKDCIVFDLVKAGNYIIEYNVPLAENGEYGNIKKECVVMLISCKYK